MLDYQLARFLPGLRPAYFFFSAKTAPIPVSRSGNVPYGNTYYFEREERFPRNQSRNRRAPDLWNGGFGHEGPAAITAAGVVDMDVAKP